MTSNDLRLNFENAFLAWCNMKYLIGILIFCLVLFFYLHIYFHLKTSNDLEVYTIERPSKEKLEEICDLRQPVTFKYINDELCSTLTLEKINANYSAFDLKIRGNEDDSDKTELYLPLVFGETYALLKKDEGNNYFTENNYEFLSETGLLRTFRHNDLFLRPPLVSKCIYDLCAGSKGMTTPLRYNMNYRNYIYVVEGEISVKLVSPAAGRYLRGEKDYDNFEFRSPMNPWNIQEEYKREYNKTKSLEIKLMAGDIVFVPAYWWYSVRYDHLSTLCFFNYRTYMNTCAISPHIIISWLQSQNIKRDIVEKVNTEACSMLE